MASWTTLITPDYSTRLDHSQETAVQQPKAQDLPSSLPTIKIAIPRTSPLPLSKIGLPVNPSPYPKVDPAIQAPLSGRASPTDFYRSPVAEQREFLSPRDISSHPYGDFKQASGKPVDAYSLSRSSSQTSLEGCQHCHCCQRRQGHTRSNSYSSISSSRTSSSINLSSASPNMSSPAATPPLEQKRSSTFGRTFKFLQRSSSVDIKSTKDVHLETHVSRKRSTSVTATKKKQPSKKLVFDMVTEDDHWANE